MRLDNRAPKPSRTRGFIANEPKASELLMVPGERGDCITQT